jgi:hypothetical protein
MFLFCPPLLQRADLNSSCWDCFVEIFFGLETTYFSLIIGLEQRNFSPVIGLEK